MRFTFPGHVKELTKVGCLCFYFVEVVCVAGTSGRLGTSERLMDRKMAISPQEAADILGVSLPTVRKLLFTGRIRFARAGRRILIPVSALEAFLNGEEVKDAASR